MTDKNDNNKNAGWTPPRFGDGETDERFNKFPEQLLPMTDADKLMLAQPEAILSNLMRAMNGWGRLR